MTPAHAGFTLLELVVAVAVFAVIGVASYTALIVVLDARNATDRESRRLAAVQYAVDTLAADLRQAAPRRVRSIRPRERAALYAPAGTGGPLIAVTRGGWPNPAGLKRSTLARVRWHLAGDRLERSWHAHPDAAAAAEPVRRLVLERVEAVDLRFRGAGGRWHDRWPPLNVAGRGLPRAVEVTLVLPDWGEVRRLVALAAHPAEPAAGAADG